MTLVAIACRGDHAEFVTDSLNYTPSLRYMGFTTKAFPLPHLDAAILSQGDGEFAVVARAEAEELSKWAVDVDELVDGLAGPLRDAWDARPAEWPKVSRTFVVGWSPAAGEFISWLLHHETGFEPQRLPAMYMIPTPWDHKPAKWEAERVADEPVPAETREWLAGHVADWLTKPEVPLPADDDDWEALVRGARGRAVSSLCSWPVGGKIWLSHLRRGAYTTYAFAEFDTTDEDVLGLVGYSLHPDAQMRSCWCDSGERYIQCHLVEEYADPCRCQSGKQLWDCCLLTPEEITAIAKQGPAVSPTTR